MTDDSRRSLQARFEALRDRQLSADEVAAYLNRPISNDERERVLELVRWFCRRYPTPAERLAYVRRATRRWTAGARRPPPDE